jgi:rubrerythrin
VSAEVLNIVAAPVDRRIERTCDACGYQVVEFRPLDHCPMCGSVREHLRPVAAVVPARAGAAA